MKLNIKNINQFVDFIEPICKWAISILSILIAAICFAVFTIGFTKFALIFYGIVFIGISIIFCPMSQFKRLITISIAYLLMFY